MGTGATPQPVAIAAAVQPIGENLVVVDNANSTVYQIGWRPARALPADRIVALGSLNAGLRAGRSMS